VIAIESKGFGSEGIEMKRRRGACIVLLALLSATISAAAENSDFLSPNQEPLSTQSNTGFTVDPNLISDLHPLTGDSELIHERNVEAWSLAGKWTSNGWATASFVGEGEVQVRQDLRMILVPTTFGLSEARNMIEVIDGIHVLEYLPPSGFLVRAEVDSLLELDALFNGLPSQHVPIEVLIDPALLELMEDSRTIPVRIDGWRNQVDETHLGEIIHDGHRWTLDGALAGGSVLDAPHDGRRDVLLNADQIWHIATNPAVAWMQPQPQFRLGNNQAVVHMNLNSVKSAFPTTLDGSGETIAVADSGLDADHGDFGSRVVGVVDAYGDRDTSDNHGGHGTHVACSAVGDGTRGSYPGTAPGAELYFQAMMRNSDGQLVGGSVHSLLTDGYNSGANIHTNSWGSHNVYGAYTSSSQDVDARTGTYDSVSSGYQGLAVLFANGNDGSSSGTVGAPATAKNSISVGSHLNRGNWAPDSVAQTSSRGPTDDGRIKPDITAPGSQVRSCRAQEATDTSGASWQNTWYLEYSGTSMATPHAAGASALVRQYLMDVGGRPSPQGALIKAMLILGAKDMGTQDIPNNDEGWGRIDLEQTLAPGDGRSIWVDDRSTLAEGEFSEYKVSVKEANKELKAVLVWSDYRSSTSASKNLVNDLDLEVIKPDGTTLLGNVFQNGRSQTGGNADRTNNVEVVLEKYASVGTWTIRVRNHDNPGPYNQNFAVAIASSGAEEVLPDLLPVENSLVVTDNIPERGMQTQIHVKIQNSANSIVENVAVQVFADQTSIATTSGLNLAAGGSGNLAWDWTPEVAGNITLSVVIDPDGMIEEGDEANNDIAIIVPVADKGVRVSTDEAVKRLRTSESTITSWSLELFNSGLRATEAELETEGMILQYPSGEPVAWSVNLNPTLFTLDSGQTEYATLTLLHPASPDPGTYVVTAMVTDLDENVTMRLHLSLIVDIIPDIDLDTPVGGLYASPVENTSFSIELTNRGNAPQGYEIELQSPSGWIVGFTDIGATDGATVASTGVMEIDEVLVATVQLTPPALPPIAGSRAVLPIVVTSQQNPSITWAEDILIEIEEAHVIEAGLLTAMPELRPGEEAVLELYLHNLGNTETVAAIGQQLPDGWRLDVDNSVTLQRNQNITIELNLKAGELPMEGDMHLVITHQSLSLAEITAQLLPMGHAALTFDALRIDDGRTTIEENDLLDLPHGNVTHLDLMLRYDGPVAWQPTIIPISNNDDVTVECEQIGTVSPGDEMKISCPIYVMRRAQAGETVSISIRAESQTLNITYEITLMTDRVLEVSWGVKIPNTLLLNREVSIDIEATNVGQGPIQGIVTPTAPFGWNLTPTTFDVSLDIDENRIFVIKLTPNSRLSDPIVGVLFSVDDGEDVIGGQFTFSLPTPLAVDTDDNEEVAVQPIETVDSSTPAPSLAFALIGLFIMAVSARNTNERTDKRVHKPSRTRRSEFNGEL